MLSVLQISFQINNKTKSSQEQQQTHRLATLSFLCSMMVDEHITLFPLLLVRPRRLENLKIK